MHSKERSALLDASSGAQYRYVHGELPERIQNLLLPSEKKVPKKYFKKIHIFFLNILFLQIATLRKNTPNMFGTFIMYEAIKILIFHHR